MLNKIKKNVHILQKHQVSFAYLFGSAARERNNALSDIDIAVYFSNIVAVDDYTEKRLSLITDLSLVLKNEVDILVLNNRFDEIVLEALKHGKIIFETDRQVRIKFRYDFTRCYLDFLPYRELYFSHIIQRLKTGTSCDARDQRHKESIEKIRRMHLNSEKDSR